MSIADRFDRTASLYEAFGVLADTTPGLRMSSLTAQPGDGFRVEYERPDGLQVDLYVTPKSACLPAGNIEWELWGGSNSDSVALLTDLERREVDLESGFRMRKADDIRWETFADAKRMARRLLDNMGAMSAND